MRKRTVKWLTWKKIEKMFKQNASVAIEEFDVFAE